jgi:formylglycine-generating enzyme required for sulfatase activity
MGMSVGLLLVSLAVAANNVPDTPHHQAQQGCHACHTDRLPSMQQSDKCQACHDPSSGQVLEDSQDKSSNRGKDQKLIDKHGGIPQLMAGQPGFPPGMSLPMYYPDSRIGAEPNPMTLIPAGNFTMGSNSRLEDEGPEHQAYSEAYRIDLYEVTNLQYQKFIEATQRRSPGHFRNRTFPAGKADHPVTYVSWFDAEAYCHWAGKRLPTEIEWEKAARGNDGRVYPWGDEFDLLAANTPVRWVELGKIQLNKTSTEIEGDTTPVAAFASGRSPYGLYDMSGNVWEWVADWYGPHPGNTRASENYGQINKVLKGGSWWDCSFYKCGISAPTFNRSFFSPRVRNSSFGFRCASDE